MYSIKLTSKSKLNLPNSSWYWARHIPAPFYQRSFLLLTQYKKIITFFINIDTKSAQLSPMPAMYGARGTHYGGPPRPLPPSTPLLPSNLVFPCRSGIPCPPSTVLQHPVPCSHHVAYLYTFILYVCMFCTLSVMMSSAAAAGTFTTEGQNCNKTNS